MNIDFTPDNQDDKPDSVPFYDDVTGKDGWRGHGTGKRLKTLQSEVFSAIERLDGVGITFQRGTFNVDDQRRDGFLLSYFVPGPDGELVESRMYAVALPVKDHYRVKSTLKERREKSLKMALFMLRNALEGMWFLRQLSPGYAPMMPFVIEKKSGKTYSELWRGNVQTENLLAAPQEKKEEVRIEFVEGEYSDGQS